MPPGPRSRVLDSITLPVLRESTHATPISVRQLRRRSLAAPTPDSMQRNGLLRTRQPRPRPAPARPLRGVHRRVAAVAVRDAAPGMSEDPVERGARLDRKLADELGRTR